MSNVDVNGSLCCVFLGVYHNFSEMCIIQFSDVNVNVLSFGLFRLIVLLQKCVKLMRIDNEMSV